MQLLHAKRAGGNISSAEDVFYIICADFILTDIWCAYGWSTVCPAACCRPYTQTFSIYFVLSVFKQKLGAQWHQSPVACSGWWLSSPVSLRNVPKFTSINNMLCYNSGIFRDHRPDTVSTIYIPAAGAGIHYNIIRVESSREF